METKYDDNLDDNGINQYTYCLKYECYFFYVWIKLLFVQIPILGGKLLLIRNDLKQKTDMFKFVLVKFMAVNIPTFIRKVE